MNGAARVRRRLLGQAGQRQLRNIGNIRNGRVRAAPAWRDALQVKIALFDRQRVSRAHCGLQLLIVSEIMRP